MSSSGALGVVGTGIFSVGSDSVTGSVPGVKENV